jgi:lysophospholipase L1-like esterase
MIANPSSPNNRTRAQFISGGSGNAARYTPTFRFMCDASAFEYEGGVIGSTFMYRLSVDGRRSVAGTTLATGASYGYVKFDFGTAKTRMIDLTIVDPDFNTIRVAATYGLWRPPQGFKRRLFAIGDSITGGANGVDRHLTWVWDAASILGCDEVWNVGVGGTGWVADGSGTTRFSGRTTSDIAPLVQPRDVVLFFGSRNDSSGNQGQIDAITAGVTSTLGLIPSSNRNVYVAGPITSIPANNAAVLAGATAAGRPYIDASTWITGSGYAGATTGSGNGDRYISNDGVHPNAAGHLYLARRWANAVRALANQ